tara:strand:- start:650 stop:1039 length:390 start_codon:yes stop_codon:yes gene_type:complete
MTPNQGIEKAKAEIKKLEEAMTIGDHSEVELLCESLESTFSKLKKLAQDTPASFSKRAWARKTPQELLKLALNEDEETQEQIYLYLEEWFFSLTRRDSEELCSSVEKAYEALFEVVSERAQGNIWHECE